MKKLRMTVNIAMTAVLLGLMAYSLIGTLTHEILGALMFVLFTVHHILNRKWFGALPKGRYNAFRIAQTTLVVMLIVSVMSSAVSGVILSEHLFRFLRISSGAWAAWSVHMVCAYLNYILMSLHLGFHWNAMISSMSKNRTKKSDTKQWIMRAAAIAIAAYGVYAFYKRQIGEYLFLQTHFVFLDPTEPLIFFFADYLSIMGLFVFIGHYLAKLLKKTGTN